MTGQAPFSVAAARARLGAASVDAIRASVEAAPPLRPEQREQLRAVFAAARPRPTPVTPALRAA